MERASGGRSSIHANPGISSKHNPTVDVATIFSSGKSIEEIVQILMGVGWKTSEFLPQNWLYKQNIKPSTLNVVSPDGTRFKALKHLIGYMKSKPHFSQEDIEMVSIFSKLVNSDDWSDSKILPDGWRTKTNNKRGPTFLSPDGLQFKSAARAFKYFIDSNPSETDKAKMENCLKVTHYL